MFQPACTWLLWIFLSTVCAIATTSSVVLKWKKGLPPWYITVDYEQKVVFVLAIIFRVVGQIICFRCSLFFWGGLLSTTTCSIDNQSGMLLINIEPNKCLDCLSRLLAYPAKVSWVSDLCVCLFVHLWHWRSYPRPKKKKTFWHLWKMHINKTQETQKYPKSEEIMTATPPPPTPQTKYPFFNLPWNPIILSVLCQ